MLQLKPVGRSRDILAGGGGSCLGGDAGVGTDAMMSIM